MNQRDAFVAIALAEVGVLYYDTRNNSRCDWSQGFTDCSGFVVGAANRAGYGPLSCTNSSGLSRMCHDAERPQWMIDQFGPGHGTQLTADQAAATRGALGFHGADEGLDGDGPSGHVKISQGNGLSVEAASHALDLIEDTFIDSKDTYYSLLPGMTGFELPPKVPPMLELDVAAWLFNPQDKGWWVAARDGRVSYLRPNGTVAQGGMVNPADRAAFGDRHVSQLKLRWYRPKGTLKRRAGFTIIATTGEKYVPSTQH